jgi:hypothetical protein
VGVWLRGVAEVAASLRVPAGWPAVVRVQNPAWFGRSAVGGADHWADLS